MIWHSPHGTQWEAETYEEALEAERDYLVEALKSLRGEEHIRTPPPEGYPVRVTKYEARLLMKLLTMQVDYPELEPEHKALFDKLEAVL